MRYVVAVGADFSGAILDQAELRGADFTGARLDRASFENTDLSQAAGIALTRAA